MFRRSQTKPWHRRPNRTEGKLKQSGWKKPRTTKPRRRNASTQKPYPSSVQHQIETKPWSKQRQIANAVDENRRPAAAKTCNGSGNTRAAAIVAEPRMMSRGIAAVISTAPGLCRSVKPCGEKHVAQDMPDTSSQRMPRRPHAKHRNNAP